MTIIRTPRARLAHQSIDHMSAKFFKRCTSLDESDCDHYLSYMPEGRRLFGVGEFDNAPEMDGPWTKYNFRYHADSINGEHGEMATSIIRNTSTAYMSNPTRSRKYSDVKDDELAGKDLLVYKVNPSGAWDNDEGGFSSQVKLSKYRLGEDFLYIPLKHFKDSYTCDRIALTNIVDYSFVEMNYEAIRYEIFEETESLVAVIVEGVEVVRIDVSKLKQYSKFNYAEYSI